MNSDFTSRDAIFQRSFLINYAGGGDVKPLLIQTHKKTTFRKFDFRFKINKVLKKISI